MKERPILFSKPMVKAILDGRKTQTRRVAKPQPDSHYWESLPGYRLLCNGPNLNNDGRYFYNFHHHIPQNPNWDEAGTTFCPYGSPGSRLWVRENFWPRPHRTERDMINGADTWEPVEYDADLSDIQREQLREWGWKMKPSIHIPRKLSRIILEITSVRIERLQDISSSDVEKEGVKFLGDLPLLTRVRSEKRKDLVHAIAQEKFKNLWNSINLKKAPWSSNPWVWVVEFQRT
jgi:hypothetical protein